jgi:hypothetical protein
VIRSLFRLPVLLVAATAFSAGCFDSLLDSPCSEGYALEGGSCVRTGDPDADPGTPDGPVGPDAPTPDAAVDGPDGGGGNADADPTAPDADPTAPDADPTAPDADPTTPDGSTSPDGAPQPDAALPPDAAPVPDAALPPDAFSCPAPLVECDGVCVDLTSDPLNCGACGTECPSGLCVDSVCVGDIVGHIVAIGHDYSAHNTPMDRLLGNSLALGKHHEVAVGWYRGTAGTSAHLGSHAAGNAGLNHLSRPHAFSALGAITPANLAGLDVVVIEAQLGDGDAAETRGANAKAALDDFLLLGGVVVVLESAGGVSYRFAHGAGLFEASGVAEVSGQIAHVANTVDAISQVVLSPYFAAPSSVTFTGVSMPVVDVNGATLALHTTR